jgi:hypothetical protein
VLNKKICWLKIFNLLKKNAGSEKWGVTSNGGIKRRIKFSRSRMEERE